MRPSFCAACSLSSSTLQSSSCGAIETIVAAIALSMRPAPIEPLAMLRARGRWSSSAAIRTFSSWRLARREHAERVAQRPARAEEVHRRARGVAQLVERQRRARRGKLRAPCALARLAAARLLGGFFALCGGLSPSASRRRLGAFGGGSAASARRLGAARRAPRRAGSAGVSAAGSAVARPRARRAARPGSAAPRRRLRRSASAGLGRGLGGRSGRGLGRCLGGGFRGRLAGASGAASPSAAGASGAVSSVGRSSASLLICGLRGLSGRGRAQVTAPRGVRLPRRGCA